MTDFTKIRDELNSNFYNMYSLKDVVTKIDKDLPMPSHCNMLIDNPNLKGKVLVIGSGMCEEIIAMKLRKPELDISCIEGCLLITKIARELIKKAGVDIKVYDYLIEEHPDFKFKFDSIVISHVIEHVDDVDDLLEYSYNNLQDDETLFLSLPYGKYHYSNEHKHFFIIDVPRLKDINTKICIETDEKEIIYLDKILLAHKLIGEINVFDEEAVKLGHKDYKYSTIKNQLDIFIAAKKMI